VRQPPLPPLRVADIRIQIDAIYAARFVPSP